MSKLTQKELKELLHYNPKTGIFTWKTTRGRFATVGVKAGSKIHRYIRIKIKYISYRAHRLAFLYMKGYIPEYGVDHKDRIRHHNWWNNLRETTQQCNIRNTGNYKTNTSGVKGVSWDKNSKKWYASIMINQKTKNLGYYNNIMEAACHRLAAEQCVDWAGCDSSSPAYQYVILGERKII